MSYHDGFEDATELCLATLEKSENKEKGIDKLKRHLGLLKEEKISRLEAMLETLSSNPAEVDAR